MKLTKVFLALVLTYVAPVCAAERSAVLDGIRVANAWVRAPAPGQQTAAAYMEVRSAQNMALAGATSAAAGRVEMHESTTEAGVMRMRALPSIELRAGETVKLAPGGMHLMLVDLRQPLKAGDKIPLTLRLRHAGAAGGKSFKTLDLELEVRSAPPASPSHHHH